MAEASVRWGQPLVASERPLTRRTEKTSGPSSEETLLARNVHMYSSSVRETRFLLELVTRTTDFPLPKMRFLGPNAPPQGRPMAKTPPSKANWQHSGQAEKPTGLCAIQFEAAAGRSHHFGENLTVLVTSHHFGEPPFR